MIKLTPEADLEARMVTHLKHIALILLAGLLVSCITIGPDVKAKCKSKAFYAAMAFYDGGYPVRLVTGTGPEGKWHIEAQARIYGFWRWIDFDLSWSDTGPKGFKIFRYYDLDEIFEMLK